jgi:hypothetical protein
MERANDGDPEIFRPHKRRWALVLLAALVFVAVGLVLLEDPDGAWERSLGYAVVGFFGLGVLVALAHMVPGSSFLVVGPAGITVRTLWRTASYRWSDLREFALGGFEACLPETYGWEHAALAEHLNRMRTRHAG